MLGVFQQVVVEIANQPAGHLATFDLMFEGIRTVLKSQIRRSILNAEQHLQDAFVVRILKALFLVKYVKGNAIVPSYVLEYLLGQYCATSPDDYGTSQQLEYFEQIQMNTAPSGINFTWEFADAIHARHIVTDQGWKILLDRGLDNFSRCETRDAFALTTRLQQYRPLKAFEVTYLRVEEG